MRTSAVVCIVVAYISYRLLNGGKRELPPVIKEIEEEYDYIIGRYIIFPNTPGPTVNRLTEAGVQLCN